MAVSMTQEINQSGLNGSKAPDRRRFQANKEHLYSELKDEAVILSMVSGKYYGLNPVGVSIWRSIQEPATLEDIHSAVMAEYEVDENTCRNEVASFLQLMSDEQLVEVLDEKNS